jgi:transcription elongation factor GreA
MAAASKSDKKKDQNILTEEGAEKLKEELNQRIKEKRVEIANRLETATEQGDLSENAAYKSALEEKELNENRITELEDILSNSIIQKQAHSKLTVGLGSEVVIKRSDVGKKQEITIVGKSESDPANMRISVDSPIGEALYGSDKGSTVKVKLPNRTIEVEIISVK